MFSFFPAFCSSPPGPLFIVGPKRLRHAFDLSPHVAIFMVQEEMEEALGDMVRWVKIVMIQYLMSYLKKY